MRLPLPHRLWARGSRIVARALVRSDRTRSWLAGARSAPVDGVVFDQELAALLRLDDVEHGSDLRGCEPAAARRKMALGIATVEDPPIDGVETRELSIEGAAGPRPGRLYEPHGLARGEPGIFFVHGGGFVTGDLDTHDTLCRKLAVIGRARVVALDYRLAPEHRFPAAADDAVAGFRWLAAHAADLGIDAARIGITGDSAGGNLSAVIARNTAKDVHPPKVHAPVYAATDATSSLASRTTYAERYMLTVPMIEWYYDRYFAKEEDKAHPDASPLLAEDVSGVSRALVYVAGFDPLRDEAVAYHERLVAAGVRSELVNFETLPHGFLLMTGMSRAAKEATERVARELGDALRA